MRAKQGQVVAFFVAVLLALPFAAQAAVTWQTNSASYWTNRLCWSTQQVPGPSDDVVFTNTGKGNCIINGDVTINSLNVATGYAAIISFTNGFAAGLTRAHDEVLDEVAVEGRHLVEHGVDDGGGEIVGTDVDERALVGPTDRAAGGGDDDGFGHGFPLMDRPDGLMDWRGGPV